MNQCSLAKELRRLKESSKEAVEGIESFSTFKQYMHVQRNVEIELVEQLSSIKEQSLKKQLVLVCGSVGDGKSHVISQIKNNRNELLEDFIIHNDATESDHPTKTYLETLDKKFELFSDERLNDDDCYKLIVAINLGTLSNFIESEEYKNKYSILKEYVKDNKIIENEIVESKHSQYISYINFSDYSLYDLIEEGPRSEFIENILEKIVSADQENEFYKISKNQCNGGCPYGEACVVKYNYEMLFSDVIRKELSNIIIAGIVRHKVILSVRSLLDFIYSIIVPRCFEEYSDGRQIEKFFNEKGIPLESIELILPNLMYEQSKRSSLFNALYSDDPLNERTEEIDQLIIDTNISREPTKLLEQKFSDDEYSKLHSVVRGINTETIDKKIMIATYLRYSKVLGNTIVNSTDHYNTYMRYLYYFNKRDVRAYGQLYNDVIKAIYAWNGHTDGDWINISATGQKSDYKLSQEMKIVPADTVIKDLNESEKCNKFSTEIRLNLRNKGIEESVNFVIDFDLYQLIMKVRQGYRLNHNDKENYISFIESIEKLMSFGDMKESIRITHKKNRQNKDYILKQDMFGGYTFESN